MCMSNPNPQNNTTTPQRTPVCNAVLQRIEYDNVQPYSRLFFQSKECFIWMIWLLTLLLGSLAVAVTIYVSMSVPYTLYEITHNNLLTAFVTALPYIWIVIFMLTAYLAIINFRHTRYGYRYQVYTVLGGSIALSLVAGAALQMAGGGYVLDQTIGEMVVAYPSYEKRRLALWQQPQEGRMIGVLVPLDEREDNNPEEQQFVFRDQDEVVWNLDTSELDERDVVLLREAGQQPVRIIGTLTASDVFHVCGVFPWFSGQAMTRSELVETRKMFMQTIRSYFTNDDTLVESFATGTGLPIVTGQALAIERVVPETPGRCADITAVRRAQEALAP